VLATSGSDSLTSGGAHYTIGSILATIRPAFPALLVFALVLPARGEVIYKAEEDDGSITFTHYRESNSLEIFIDDELENRPSSFADIDPETVYRNLDAYDDLILEHSASNDVSPALVKAMILVESGFNYRAVSPRGAQGLMQLMPKTGRSVGVEDPFDPAQNIAGGVKYLRKQIDRFGGNVDMAVAAYNAGPGAVLKYGGTPPYKETQFYVQHVTKLYDYFATERPVRGSR
jgi:hypothetical protein